MVHPTSMGDGCIHPGCWTWCLWRKKILYVEWDCLVGIVVTPSEVGLLFFCMMGSIQQSWMKMGVSPLQSDHLWHSWLIEGKYPKLNRGCLLGGTSSCSSNLGYIWSAEWLKLQSLGNGLPIAWLVWIPPVVVVVVLFQLFQHFGAYSQIVYHPIRHHPIHTLHPNPLRRYLHSAPVIQRFKPTTYNRHCPLNSKICTNIINEVSYVYYVYICVCVCVRV